MSDLQQIIKKIEDGAHSWSNKDRVSIEASLTKAEYDLFITALKAADALQSLSDLPTRS